MYCTYCQTVIIINIVTGTISNNIQSLTLCSLSSHTRLGLLTPNWVRVVCEQASYPGSPGEGSWLSVIKPRRCLLCSVLQQLELRWTEYYELVTIIRQWISHHVVIFGERRFPGSYEEIEVSLLLGQLLVALLWLGLECYLWLVI